MRKCFVFLLCAWPALLMAGQSENQRRFFVSLTNLEFDSARQTALLMKDSLLKYELIQLTDLLYFEGQKGREYFRLRGKRFDPGNPELSAIRALNAGYVSLFYDRTKGKAYQYFYEAYQLAKESDNRWLIKTSLLAFFKYYGFEIVQASDSYRKHLEQFEKIKESYSDEVWLSVYRMIYYSKPAGKINDDYFKVAQLLAGYERGLSCNSHLLAYVYYEKAIEFEIRKDLLNSERYFQKVIDQCKDYPFLKDKKFYSLLKLANFETGRKRFAKAHEYLVRASRETNLADSLRSAYYLNLYSAFFYRAKNQNDSAFASLKSAYFQEFELDFRRNTLEINQLNIELETREKENANLLLRQEKWWLLSALVVSFLLIITGYFAYAGRQAQSKMQLQQKEVQAMKLEKQLKEQEMLGIDLMIEGQEKERQRIANDLHDDLGAQLAAMKIKLESMEKQLAAESEPKQLLLETTSLLNEAYQKVRSMAHARHAGINAQDGLLPAVRNFASKVSVANRLAIQVEEHGMDTRLENSLEITLFRIIQELITNVIKHAQASEVIIHLIQHETSINVMVEDNGTGFDIATIQPGETMGLYSIQKRIENLGGQVTIDSIAQKGTTVIIDIPLA